MMANLFSSFDPSTNIYSVNWISSLIIFLIMPPALWMIPSRYSFLWNTIISSIHKEFKILTKNSKGSTLMFTSIFSLILFNNFMGLFPYIFTSTSHMTMTLSIALPLWISFMLIGWINNTTHMLAHLVPQGTPPVLMPFMVCIESISNVIRPGTLAIRLSANMIAGHLLMTLLGNTGPILSLPLINFLIIVQIALLTLESAVSIIQSYVFSILSTLYFSEVN
uniref:ATP synthase subunit a n=1 Tax=Oryzaephilus surinamensis TaxID=41112 RepID=A0A1P8YZK0_ORYSU|nr:ATP synthase F0 subunit 6 [Oryzaephilus surinamensis]QCP68863.1 ATP synthase F0 subunit 6 [Oryzaephilus surinamensis]QTJ25277.1 ATP synthase F0 subunit 6 [Oryzaephilus surinamensis]UNH68020.1 ATP synthase F0 subunit 6 [Oryzaephilus surinamensis]